MGGRHASRVISHYRDKHGRFTRYGEEYRCEQAVGKIKFVSRQSRNGFKDPPAAPLETRMRGRIYLTIGKNGQPKAITYYDKHGGYNHNRYLKMTKLDKWLVRHVDRLWKERKND